LKQEIRGLPFEGLLFEGVASGILQNLHSNTNRMGSGIWGSVFGWQSLTISLAGFRKRLAMS
jgi:hypothetical protein